MIRVCLVEDHAVIRAALRLLLDAAPGITVVGETGSGAAALKGTFLDTCDVLLLDLGLPDIDGSEVLKRARELRPRLPILILSTLAEGPHAVCLLRAGAAGYVHKGCPREELVAAITKVARGGRHISERLAELLLEPPPPGEHPLDGLTERQLQILRLIGQGRSTSDIAAELDLTVSTISTHLHRIKSRLRLRTQGQLAQFASRVGLT